MATVDVTSTLQTAEKDTSVGQKTSSPLAGLVLAILAGLSYSISSTIAGQLLYMSAIHLYWLRCANTLVFTLPVLLYRNRPIIPSRSLWLPLSIRSTFLGFNTFLRYLSFSFMPVALANVLCFCDFIYSFLFGWLFLREVCGILQVLSVVIALIGLGFICRINDLINGIGENGSSTNLDYLFGITSASASAICSSISCIAVKKMTSLHPIDIVFFYALLNVVVSTPLVFSIEEFQTPKTVMEGWFVILLGLFSLAGQALTTAALKIYHTGAVTLTKSASDILLLFVWQMAFFNDFPDVSGVIGACLVASASFLTHIQALCKRTRT